MYLLDVLGTFIFSSGFIMNLLKKLSCFLFVRFLSLFTTNYPGYIYIKYIQICTFLYHRGRAFYEELIFGRVE